MHLMPLNYTVKMVTMVCFTPVGKKRNRGEEIGRGVMRLGKKEGKRKKGERTMFG